MGRPALSALRALEIIDLMAGMPAQALTLSEIVRLTGTNVASCHAILSVLVARGYLLRHPVHKAYRLAPSIVAIGEAAASHDPLLTSAREAAASLAQSTGLETTLTARAGADIIGVARYGRSPLGRPSLRVGQRVPLHPPIGGLFMAWATPAEIEAWIAPDGEQTPAAARDAHRAALTLVRQRGFLVSLASPAFDAVTRELQDARGTDAGDAFKLTRLFAALDNSLYQPGQIESAQAYPVKLVAAPIFDARGNVLYTLNLNFPPAETPGDRLLALATTLLDMCAASMQANAIDPHAVGVT